MLRMDEQKSFFFFFSPKLKSKHKQMEILELKL